jgi:hypothetical protein
MPRPSNDLLMQQITQETAAVTSGLQQPDALVAHERLWVLLGAAPLAFLQLYRFPLSAALATLPGEVDAARIAGAAASSEARKDVWNSIAGQVHEVQSVR